jgi:hypothetical protein
VKLSTLDNELDDQNRPIKSIEVTPTEQKDLGNFKFWIMQSREGRKDSRTLIMGVVESDKDNVSKPKPKPAQGSSIV